MPGIVGREPLWRCSICVVAAGRREGEINDIMRQGIKKAGLPGALDRKI